MSDEADRIRTYQELARRGQAVPGKNFGTGVTPKTKKIVPKVKVIDTTKMKQIKLLKYGGDVSKKKDPNASIKGVATVIKNISSGKTGIKTADKQKKKDAVQMAKLKRGSKAPRVRVKAETFDITPKKGGLFDVNKNTIFQAANGGEVMNMTRSIIINPKTGE
jgi:hypothetical protein